MQLFPTPQTLLKVKRKKKKENLCQKKKISSAKKEIQYGYLGEKTKCFYKRKRGTPKLNREKREENVLKLNYSGYLVCIP